MIEDARGINEDELKKKMEKISFYAEDIYEKLDNIDSIMSTLKNHYKCSNSDKLYARYKIASESYIKLYKKILGYNESIEANIINYHNKDTKLADSIGTE